MSAGAPTARPAVVLRAAPAEVREALASFAAGRELLAQPEARAHALAGGVENRVWRVVGPYADWVVRLGGGRDARLAVDRRRELACVTLAASHGFAPGIVHAAPGSGLLVAAHVAGRTWSRDDARALRNVARFGARLRALHAVPVPSSLPAVDPGAAIEGYLALDPPPQPPVPRAKLASAAAASLAAVAPRAHALCHHDLHHRNVIDAGELVFVDWEYAGRGEPLLDLAAFAAYHDFDAPRRAALLAAYEAGGPPPQRLADAHEVGGASPERFAAACTLFDCLQALWYDAADAWHTLGADARAALIQRLALSPRRSARAAACAGTPRRPP